MEDAIMDCWSITDELQHFAEYGSDARTTKLLQSLAVVYDFKMERMNDLYELCLKDYYELKNASTPGKIHLTDKLIEDIAQEFADLDGGIFCDKWVPYARAVIKEQENDVPW
jgi:hypothetical protein